MRALPASFFLVSQLVYFRFDKLNGGLLHYIQSNLLDKYLHVDKPVAAVPQPVIANRV
ncbi:melibiose permease [Kosakonia sacchari]|nr:melibiose permease [Kosakonia sacchari]